MNRQQRVERRMKAKADKALARATEPPWKTYERQKRRNRWLLAVGVLMFALFAAARIYEYMRLNQ